MTADSDSPAGAAGRLAPRRLEAAIGTFVSGLPPSTRIVVAFSGGLDSTVLLNALTRAQPSQPLAAVHVDHRLHPDSGRWAGRCVDAAAALGIDCTVLPVDATPAPGQSPEAAAREARYGVLSAWLGDADTLVTAHHGDDQLETLLLRVLRGTGVRGLGAIRQRLTLGRGRIERPLLDFSRSDLAAVAADWRLDWITDPSNADPRFDRNYLRAAVLPPIVERWPAAHRVAARLARHMESADALLDALAAIDAGGETEPDRFPVERLLALDMERRANLLRHLIRRAGLPTPEARVLVELVRQLDAAPAANVCVAWPGAEARAYQRRLYLLGALPPARAGAVGRLDRHVAWTGPEGRLALERTDGPGLPAALVERGLAVCFRRGGERFTPAGSRVRKTLKHWFQEQQVVPWMRSRVPLLYAGDTLVAVADLAVANLDDADPGAAASVRGNADLATDARARSDAELAAVAAAGSDADRHGSREASGDAAASGTRWRPVWTDHPRIR